MDINFELYKIFYHASVSESFSGAAKNLFISQSAVSQTIKNLEEKLGVTLFQRNSRNITLTTEGKLLFSHVEQAYNFLKTAENKISEIRNMESGEIKIGASDTVCRYHIRDHLEQFNKLYPNIKINVINRTSSQILSLLKNGIIDLGIITLPVKDESVSVNEFLAVQDIFIASHKFSSLSKEVISFTKISGYPVLMLDKNSSTRHNIDTFFKAKGIEIVPEIELESVDLLVDFARIGLGISCVLKESANDALQKNEVFEIKTEEMLPLRKLGIVSIKTMPLSQAASKFIELVIAGK